MKIKFFSIFSLLIILLAVFSSCKDDLLFDDEYIGEGKSIISATVTFNPLTVSTLSRATGGTEGDAIKAINNITVLLYDESGDLCGEPFFIPVTSQNTSENTSVSTDGVGSNEHQAEEKTSSVSFKLKGVNFGKYYMYAVANVPDLYFSETNRENYATVSNLKSNIFTWNSENIASNNQMFGYFSTDDRSKGFDASPITIKKPTQELHAWIRRLTSKVTVAFDGNNLKPGVQIFIKSVRIKDIPRYCFLGKVNTPPYDVPGYTEEDKQAAAEKLPLDQVLISSPGQIMDYCPDGFDPETATSESYTADWPGLVSKDHPINGFNPEIVASNNFANDKAKLAALHGENINALYFYENMQGQGEHGTPTDKKQDVGNPDDNTGNHANSSVSYPDGVDPTDIAWKDAKKYGTYIEVQAYYRALNTDGTLNTNEGEGPITYRFMLGKDTHLDYDAERNYHYKLTLCFNGWANDVDWHIDYKKETQELRFPHPFYISYLYDHMSMIPMEFDAPQDAVIKEVKARIIKNDWYPSSAIAEWGEGKTDAIGTSSEMKLVFPEQPGTDQYSQYARYVDAPILMHDYMIWNGFLSLEPPFHSTTAPTPEGSLNPEIQTTWFNQGGWQPPLATADSISTLASNNVATVNALNFFSENSGNQSFKIYPEDACNISTEPLYEVMDIYKQLESKGKLHISWANGTFYVKLPIFTRARQLIGVTGFTGNNPYYGYYREARVQVEITYEIGGKTKTLTSRYVYDPDQTVSKPDEDYIQVQQVRRIVNPKGVYRSATNTNPFHVNLGVLADEDDTEFTWLESRGPWRAYVVMQTGGNFVTLSGSGTYANYTFKFNGQTRTVRSIEGKSDSSIDFTINFHGESTAQPRYALIRVEYNYNSCYHVIFVRQGYQADRITAGGPKWCIGNLVAKGKIADNPLDEGSLFRYGNLARGIKAVSNVNGWAGNNLKIVPNDFFYNKGVSLKFTDGKTGNWSDVASGTLPATSVENTPDFSESFTIDGKTYHIATYDDYMSLLAPSDIDERNWNIKNAYGVCYGDGASSTSQSVLDAFGYLQDEEEVDNPKTRAEALKKGMRGCFVYNADNGNNLFFPIGNSGYGLRKTSSSFWPKYENENGTEETVTGLLRYSSHDRWGYFNTTVGSYDPYGLYMAPLFLDIFRSNGALYWFGVGASAGGYYYPAWDINYSTFDFNPISDKNVMGGDNPENTDACFIRCVEE